MRARVMGACSILAVAVCGLSVARATANSDPLNRSPWNVAKANPEKSRMILEDSKAHEALQAVADDPVAAHRLDNTKAGERAFGAPTEPVPAWPFGIFQEAEAPASRDQMLATGRWVGAAGRGVATAVYVGRSGTDQSVGRLLILDTDARMHVVNAVWIDAPGRGTLTLVGATGAILTMSDASGRALRFNVATESWL